MTEKDLETIKRLSALKRIFRGDGRNPDIIEKTGFSPWRNFEGKTSEFIELLSKNNNAVDLGWTVICGATYDEITTRCPLFHHFVCGGTDHFLGIKKNDELVVNPDAYPKNTHLFEHKPNMYMYKVSEDMFTYYANTSALCSIVIFGNNVDCDKASEVWFALFWRDNLIEVDSLVPIAPEKIYSVKKDGNVRKATNLKNKEDVIIIR